MFLQHYVTVNWCREFAMNFAIFLQSVIIILHFRPWFSSSSNDGPYI